MGAFSACLALLLLVPAPSIGTLMAMRILPGRVGQVIYGICKIWLLALPLFWTWFVDRDALGWSPPSQRGLFVGAAVGIILGIVIFAVYGLFGKHWIDAAHVQQMAKKNGIGSPGVYLAFAIYLALINSLLEEYVWRWFVFGKCEAILPGWTAVTTAALLFTIHHVVALWLQFSRLLTLLGGFGVMAGGVMWSWFYLRYRSVWPGYVSHVILDVTILSIGWLLIFNSPATHPPSSHRAVDSTI